MMAYYAESLVSKQGVAEEAEEAVEIIQETTAAVTAIARRLEDTMAAPAMKAILTVTEAADTAQATAVAGAGRRISAGSSTTRSRFPRSTPILEEMEAKRGASR